MTMTKNRFSEEDVESLKSLLQAQKDIPPPKTITTRQLIQLLKPELQELKQQGWGWADVSELLIKKGMQLNQDTLRDYLKERPKPKPLKPLVLTELATMYQAQSLDAVNQELKKRNKVTLSRFYKSLTQDKNVSTNKMQKEDLVTSIALFVVDHAKNKCRAKEPPNSIVRSSGDHDDLFNIDLGI